MKDFFKQLLETHTQVEMVHKDDVNVCADLIKLYIENMI